MATKKKEELGSSLLGVSENTARNLANYQAGYQEGERVQNAYNEYNNLKQNAPQAYVSPYQAQLDEIYSKITNRTPFKYNLNGDMLYQNAKEQYQQLGKQAMVDTIGQATQLTGGYGNSYAQNAGNQAYQQYLLKLNEQIPEYYKLAMDRYNMEGDQLNNQYALTRDMEDQSYGRYRDLVSDYNNNLQMAYNIYGDERDNDYDKYADALAYWQNQAGAENKDYWTQTNFDYQKQQDALAQSNYERELAMKQQQHEAEMAYKYAALAQKRAAQAAKEEADRKAKEEEEKKKQSTDTPEANKAYSLTRYAQSNGSALKNNGLGVALSTDDAIRAHANEMAERQSSVRSAITPENEKSPELKKIDLNINTSGNTLEMADYISQQLLEIEDSYPSHKAFVNAVADTLQYYYDNNMISDGVIKLITSKFK